MPMDLKKELADRKKRAAVKQGAKKDAVTSVKKSVKVESKKDCD